RRQFVSSARCVRSAPRQQNRTKPPGKLSRTGTCGPPERVVALSVLGLPRSESNGVKKRKKHQQN
uniref:Uncharacterized protein n=1 Tax=Anopheles dirus TaxID=7168 RepID=A0A182NXV6_9DIPT